MRFKTSVARLAGVVVLLGASLLPAARAECTCPPRLKSHPRQPDPVPDRRYRARRNPMGGVPLCLHRTVPRHSGRDCRPPRMADRRVSAKRESFTSRGPTEEVRDRLMGLVDAWPLREEREQYGRTEP